MDRRGARVSKPQDCKHVFFEADSTNWRASDKRLDSHDVEFIRADLCVTNFVTAKQAFERAYGPIPEGATCHIGVDECLAVDIYPTVYVPFYDRVIHGKPGGFEIVYNGKPAGPDISDRPASAFIGFFDEAYDNAVRELEAGE